MKCLDVVKEDKQEIGAMEDEVLDVVKDMQEVGGRSEGR